MQNEIMFGKLFKVRSNKNDLPIAINSGDKIVDTFKKGKLHRPYVVFYSNDYVYYLSVKSITEKNEFNTIKDDRNVIIPNINIYGNEAPIGNAINCSVINVMDRELFESLFEKDSKWNDVELDAKIYKDVMSKLHYTLHSNNVQFSQVIGFTETKTKFIKQKNINSEIKTAAISFIKTYYELLKIPLREINEALSKLPNEYSILKKHFVNLAKHKEKENIAHTNQINSTEHNENEEEINTLEDDEGLIL
ncbi:hypothetical protein MbovWib_00415 [Mycoplasmopsis bovis]|uniref:Mbov_0400 family ICE element protein n=1 Tax=Mycoplasmopsis bovis TaxID=28903 RepID=UPI0027A70F1A